MHATIHPRTFDFASSCLFIEPFRIALLHNFERRIDEDFDKVETRILVDLASKRAIGTIGRDERSQRDARRIRKQARDLNPRRPQKKRLHGPRP
jgi:hypothetical protein